MKYYLLEFKEEQKFVEATKQLMELDYRILNTYTPYPIEELPPIKHRNLVPLFTLLGGILGFTTAAAIQTIPNLYTYPMNVGGRPYFSWPAFIPVAFELTVLFASFSALISLIIQNRLIHFYHPYFDIEHFERASIDRFFISLKSEYSIEKMKKDLSPMTWEFEYEV